MTPEDLGKAGPAIEAAFKEMGLINRHFSTPVENHWCTSKGTRLYRVPFL